MIYENGSLKRILVDGGYIEDGVYHFYIQDHLGNNRVVAKADGTVVQTNHYYLYGMSFAESTNLGRQPYKYNGKELDSENSLNLYDYEARHYDPVLGRFMTMDPMAEKYYSISSYAYCLNSPLKYIDSDGRQVIPVPAPVPFPIYYPIPPTNYRYPTTYEVKQAVNNGVNFVRSSFALGTLSTVTTVMSVNKAISPEYDHQRNREKREKRELDQNQANVTKSIDTNVSGKMPNGDPAPKREPKGKIGKIVIGSGLIAAFIDSILNPTELNKPNTGDNATEIKQDPSQEDKPLWQRIEDMFN